MINIGAIKIQDSGYIKPTNEGTQATSGNRMNSGNVVTLKTARFVPLIKRNISDNPDVGTNIPAEINLGSLENMKFQLQCLFNSKESSDMDNIKHLLDSVITDGYKFMWYDFSVVGENNTGQLLYQIALNDKFGHKFTAQEQIDFSVSSDFYHLHVLFTSFQPVQTGDKSNIMYNLNGIVVKVEESTI